MIKPPRGSQLNFAHPLWRNLVGWYDFNELTGNIVNDISSYKNNGNLINSPSWVPSPDGGALDFNPSNQEYINAGIGLGNTLGTVSELSVFIRFKTDVNTPSLRGLFSISALDTTAGQFNLRFAENELLFLMYFNVFNHGIVWSDTILYHDLIAIYSGFRGILYIDNAKVIDEPFSTDLTLEGLKTFLGVYNTITRVFDGQISRAGIWNRTILSHEVPQVSNLPDDVYLQDTPYVIHPFKPPTIEGPVKMNVSVKKPNITVTTKQSGISVEVA